MQKFTQDLPQFICKKDYYKSIIVLDFKKLGVFYFCSYLRFIALLINCHGTLLTGIYNKIYATIMVITNAWFIPCPEGLKQCVKI